MKTIIYSLGDEKIIKEYDIQIPFMGERLIRYKGKFMEVQNSVLDIDKNELRIEVA